MSASDLMNATEQLRDPPAAISTPREYRDDYDPPPAPGRDERAREVLDGAELAGYYRQKGRRT